MLLVLGVGLGVLVAVLSNGDEGPKPVSGTPKEAVDVVEAFRHAVTGRDFATVCDELFTIEAREAAGGDDCQSVLTQETAKLRRPNLKILSLTVYKGGAIVAVGAAEGGRRPVRDTIRLVRQRGRFRISSAGPVPARGP